MRIETPKLWLPRTGQTTSYADGDDGFYQAGNPRATRFVDNLNGTVSDRATGLMRVKSSVAMGAPFDAGMTWADAMSNLITLNAGAGYAGYNDWRIPNLFEGLTITDHSSGSVPPPFVAYGGLHWCSTSIDAYYAYVYYEYHYSYIAYTAAKTDSRPVRPVRGGRINA